MRLDVEKKVFLLEKKLSVLKHKEASFDWAMNAVNRELFTATVDCATLRWNGNVVLSMLKTLEADLGKSLKVVFE